MLHALCHPSYARLTRYVVESSDVLSEQLRVNVYDEHDKAKVLFYKERFLSDTEIVDHLVHNPTSTILWTIHRPKRGWYLRIRSPTFPPKLFIQLSPVTSKSLYHTEGALSFITRTNVPRSIHLSPRNGGVPVPNSISRLSMNGARHSDVEPPTMDSTPSSTSYPPTSANGTPPPAPPSVLVYPPTPHRPRDSYSSQASSSSSTSSSPRQRGPPPPTQLTSFLLTPHSFAPQPVPLNSSIWDKAMSYIKTHRPSHSNSFTLSRIPNGVSILGQASQAGPGSARNGAVERIPEEENGVRERGGDIGSLGGDLNAAAAAMSNVSLVNEHESPSISPPVPGYSHHPTSSESTLMPSSLSSRSDSNPAPNSHPQSNPHQPREIDLIKPHPLLIFHDQTPVFTVRTLHGILELDQGEAREMSVDPAFWIAVGLAFLGFLEERESYFAALSD
ncbi:hypothetical protein BDV98DRAFT_574304 [Pterulicium gracile]|uniref:Uncharacterized protein n=1 Tax=Pterulicium gracile TaxID=1884261 RepID=A0A5C3Q632_9AGAR|nr:hypothetical protein BDV98DRAFT_574304 [Pterula gracilis]